MSTDEIHQAAAQLGFAPKINPLNGMVDGITPLTIVEKFSGDALADFQIRYTSEPQLKSGINCLCERSTLVVKPTSNSDEPFVAAFDYNEFEMGEEKLYRFEITAFTDQGLEVVILDSDESFSQYDITTIVLKKVNGQILQATYDSRGDIVDAPYEMEREHAEALFDNIEETATIAEEKAIKNGSSEEIVSAIRAILQKAAELDPESEDLFENISPKPQPYFRYSPPIKTVHDYPGAKLTPAPLNLSGFEAPASFEHYPDAPGSEQRILEADLRPYPDEIIEDPDDFFPEELALLGGHISETNPATALKELTENSSAHLSFDGLHRHRIKHLVTDPLAHTVPGQKAPAKLDLVDVPTTVNVFTFNNGDVVTCETREYQDTKLEQGRMHHLQTITNGGVENLFIYESRDGKSHSSVRYLLKENKHALLSASYNQDGERHVVDPLEREETGKEYGHLRQLQKRLGLAAEKFEDDEKFSAAQATSAAMGKLKRLGFSQGILVLESALSSPSGIDEHKIVEKTGSGDSLSTIIFTFRRNQISGEMLFDYKLFYAGQGEAFPAEHLSYTFSPKEPGRLKGRDHNLDVDGHIPAEEFDKNFSRFTDQIADQIEADRAGLMAK